MLNNRLLTNVLAVVIGSIGALGTFSLIFVLHPYYENPLSIFALTLLIFGLSIGLFAYKSDFKIFLMIILFFIAVPGLFLGIGLLVTSSAQEGLGGGLAYAAGLGMTFSTLAGSFLLIIGAFVGKILQNQIKKGKKLEQIEHSTPSDS